jgi:transcriptional regulator with XRE-family HTH domain
MEIGGDARLKQPEKLFSALLRHWRTRRGYSQLDLALAAETSARHLSFLETGRAQPSREMVLRLGAVLEVPLRDQNAMLRAADLPPEFPEPSLAEALPAPIDAAISRMLAQHEPFPMVVLDQRYYVLRRNQSATRLMGAIIADPSAVPARPNMLRTLFDPRLARKAIVGWERTARALLSRARRESLGRPSDMELAALVAELSQWHDFLQPDVASPAEPVLTLRVRAHGTELAFLVAVTVFSAPHEVALDELRIESYFPLDQATTDYFQR